MELVLLIGIPASGKSSFCRRRLFDSHVRINRDQLRTKHREKLLLGACLEGGIPVVVDNTNLTRSERERFILPAREAGFRVQGYFFQSRVRECVDRNAERGRPVPDQAVSGGSRRMQLPRYEEGFHALFFVRLEGDDFVISDWCE